MATASIPAAQQGSPTNILFTVLKFLAIMLLDAFALVVIYTFLDQGNLPFAFVFFVITLGANIIFVLPSLAPLRWMAPGLMLVSLLVIFPIAYTVQTAFTNYSDGHLFTQQQAATLIENSGARFVGPESLTYDFEVFQAEDGTYALWLVREADDGTVETVFAPQNAPIVAVEGAPEELEEGYVYEGYTYLGRGARVRLIQTLQSLTFGEGEDTAGIAGAREAARPLSSRYDYDEVAGTIIDRSTGQVYVANDDIGAFIPQNGQGEPLSPGYRVNVGIFNFERLITDPGLRGPLVQIFIWTVMFALLSVLTTFTMGLFMALILNDSMIPGRKIIRSLLIIPYAMPGVIGILVWRGMLNQNLGIITNFGRSVGVDIPWLIDPNWAKIAIVMVNLWLGYPYMMLICSGALQAIPSEVYEAAAVDGANPWQRFWGITLPLLLITVGPLLIASFVFNFNNYLMIELLTRGDPPIPGSPVPAGYTDILISYTYGVAFGSNRGADYGYAAAITIVIFIIVATITLLQYRFTRGLEEVSENV